MTTHQRTDAAIVAVVVALLLAAVSVNDAAQAARGATGVVPPAAGETLQQRILQASAVSQTDRLRMLANLDAVFGMGLPAAGVESVFPGGDRELSPEVLLQLQQTVIDVARDGLPVDLVLAKVREGRTKGAGEAQLVRATERMAEQVRSAHRILEQTRWGGGIDAADRGQRHHMLDEVAEQLWRGLSEEGYRSLCETARERPGGNECRPEDVVAAGEVAVRLLEVGVERERALHFVRETIRHGYRHREMRQIQVMVAACNRQGDEQDEFMRNMERCVRGDMQPTEMYDYMMRHGWMGAGEIYGPGGPQPVDVKGRSGSQGNERGKRQGGGGPNP